MANHKIEIDKEKCIGCKICYKSCFVDVLRWDEENNIPVAAYVQDCAHCFYCEALCPKECIKVTPDFEGERFYQSFDQYR